MRKAKLPMPINSSFKSLLGVLLTLIIVLVGMSIFILFIPVIHDQRLGLFILGIGVVNILFHKSQGRTSFKWGRAKLASTFDYWGWIGERGAQLLYLVIGIILSGAGAVLVVESLL